MTKIHITGNAGAGKTTIANELGGLLAIQVFGLDQIVWQPGWVKTPPDVRLSKELMLTSKPDWIIEGVSDIVREAADIVIFLDVSRKTSYMRCIKRNWKFLFSSRPELPENCPEILIIPRLLKIIWTFKTNVRPKILLEALNRPASFFIVKKQTDLEHAYRYIDLTLCNKLRNVPTPQN